MDQQHREDLSTVEAATAKKKKNAIVLCKRRLKSIHHFRSMNEFNSIWNEDSTVQLQKFKKKNLTALLRMFNVEGRAKLLNNDPMRKALSELAITQASIDLLKSNLLQQLEEYGEEYDPDEDGAMDSSFAGGSIADTSIVDTSNVNTLIVDTSIINSSIVDTSIIDIDETSGEENSVIMFIESETSGGDAGSSSESDNTVELDALIEGAQKKKSVSFNKSPAIRTFTAYSSSSSSSSDVDTYSPRRPRPRRRAARYRDNRTTRTSNRRPAATTPATTSTPTPTPTPTPPPLPPPTPSQPASHPVVLRRSARRR
jgi:hypothetical protein